MKSKQIVTKLKDVVTNDELDIIKKANIIYRKYVKDYNYSIIRLSTPIPKRPKKRKFKKRVIIFRKVTADDIIDDLKNIAGDFFTKKRYDKISKAKQILCYILHKRGLTLAEICRIFEENGLTRDHSTVIHSIKTISDILKVQDYILDEYKNIFAKYLKK